MSRFVLSRAAVLTTALAGAAGIALLGSAGRAQEADPPPPALPIDTSQRLVDAPGSELVYATCTVCHTVSPILAHDGLTPEMWADQVDIMRRVNGATFDDATAEQIVAYLSAHYSDPPPSPQEELLGPAMRLAAEAAATPTVDVPADDNSFAVAVVQGSCAAPGNAVWSLGQTAAWGGENPIVRTPGGPVLETRGTIESKLDAFVLTGYPRALTVRMGTTADAPLIACGDIVDNKADDRLVVVVSPVSGSGIGGLATFDEHPQGFAGFGGTAVDAEVLLVRGALAGQPASAPAALTPAPTAVPVAALIPVGECADGSKGDCLPVGMRDIFFDPDMLSAPSGSKTEIDVVNQGAIIHNFSIDARGNDSLTNLGVSVTLQPGGTDTVSVDAPAGDYYFYCNIPGHEAAGMRGYLTVAENGELGATKSQQTPPMR